MISIQYYKTKIGELILGAFNNKLCMLDFKYRKTINAIDNRLQKGLCADFIEKENSLLDQTKIQIDEYLHRRRKRLDISLLIIGTAFQKSVWQALIKIAYGETSTYLQLAKNINHSTAVRAVANANGANALGFIIPCHRIIGSNGELTGYSGGLSAKQHLLQLEEKTQR